jgi:hypothetical protein
MTLSADMMTARQARASMLLTKSSKRARRPGLGPSSGFGCVTSSFIGPPCRAAPHSGQASTRRKRTAIRSNSCYIKAMNAPVFTPLEPPRPLLASDVMFLVEHGLIDPNAKFELMDGAIIPMSA